jgi:transcriptional regulator with XRE-family HTH domain
VAYLLSIGDNAMPEINPKALRLHRDRKNLTLDDLASKATVDRGTISKIETGKRTNPRASTLRKLAEALGVEPGDLTSLDISGTERSPLSLKSQMNFKMANDARNALHLTAIRYDTKPSHILHLAPLLFRWAAEMSLQWRRDRLAELESQLEALSKSSLPKHLSGVVIDNWRGDEILDDEQRSIDQRDIFGQLLNEDSFTASYEESEQNPMAQFLNSIAASLGDDVNFEHWSPHWGHPGYTLGKTEALELTGGNESAAQQIVDGYAPLHEMPKEVRDRGADAVAAWAIETGALKLSNLVDFDAILNEMGISDV